MMFSSSKPIFGLDEDEDEETLVASESDDEPPKSKTLAKVSTASKHSKSTTHAVKEGIPTGKIEKSSSSKTYAKIPKKSISQLPAVTMSVIEPLGIHDLNSADSDAEEARTPLKSCVPGKQSTSERTAKIKSLGGIIRRAIEAIDNQKGVSIVAIKRYIKNTHPEIDSPDLNAQLKIAIKKGIDNQTLKRPDSNSESKQYGLVGRLLVATGPRKHPNNAKSKNPVTEGANSSDSSSPSKEEKDAKENLDPKKNRRKISKQVVAGHRPITRSMSKTRNQKA